MGQHRGLRHAIGYIDGSNVRRRGARAQRKTGIEGRRMNAIGRGTPNTRNVDASGNSGIPAASLAENAARIAIHNLCRYAEPAIFDREPTSVVSDLVVGLGGRVIKLDDA